jgi:hypothetical protein
MRSTAVPDGREVSGERRIRGVRQWRARGEVHRQKRVSEEDDDWKNVTKWRTS